jgi:DNA modification methylase
MKSQKDERYYKHELLALARALVQSIGNLRFGPEVGIGEVKRDAPAITAWLRQVDRIVRDLGIVRTTDRRKSQVYLKDARQLSSFLKPRSIDAIITSPPYPNEKDYTRTTRLETVLLGFVNNKQELRDLKRRLLRSNTRTVYKDDEDDEWVSAHTEIQRIATAIEKRRVDLQKTSGFERLYPRVTKLYFGGMARHLADLRAVLKPGAHLAYVVGDQASYLQIMIQTGQLLADIAKSLGYEVLDIELFRTRPATATREQLREEVVLLRWPG